MADCLDCGFKMNKRSKYRKHIYCEPCRIERRKETQRQSMRRQYNKYYLWLQEKGCEYCAVSSPSCLEVHHLCKNSKRYDTTSRGQSYLYNKQDVESGIAIVLCANCHSTFHRHWGGKGAQFPDQTIESTMNIIDLEYKRWEDSDG